MAQHYNRLQGKSMNKQPAYEKNHDNTFCK